MAVVHGFLNQGRDLAPETLLPMHGGPAGLARCGSDLPLNAVGHDAGVGFAQQADFLVALLFEVLVARAVFRRESERGRSRP